MASIPACDATAPTDPLDPTRLAERPLGSRVSVQGFLTIQGGDCTMMACFTIDPATGVHRRAPCCNSCTAFWVLAGPEAPDRMTWPKTPIFLKRPGDQRFLYAGGLDCIVQALAASPREEVIATGRLTRPTGNGIGVLEIAIPGALAIDDAALCATGRWAPSPAPADAGTDANDQAPDRPGCP